MMRRFFCRVVRPAFEATVVEVQASTSDAVVKKALDHVAQNPTLGWQSVLHDPSLYSAHVQAILDVDTLGLAQEAARERVAQFCAEPSTPGLYYFILAAHVNSGCGTVLLQPWFERLAPIAQGDLCEDWGKVLNTICENDGLEGVITSKIHLLNITKTKNIIPFKYHTSTT